MDQVEVVSISSHLPVTGAMIKSAINEFLALGYKAKSLSAINSTKEGRYVVQVMILYEDNPAIIPPKKGGLAI